MKHYAKVVAGEIVKIESYLQRKNPDGSPFTDAQWEAIGYYPIHEADPIPPEKEAIDTLAEMVNGEPKWVYELIDAPTGEKNNILDAPKRGFGGKTLKELIQ